MSDQDRTERMLRERRRRLLEQANQQGGADRQAAANAPRQKPTPSDPTQTGVPTEKIPQQETKARAAQQKKRRRKDEPKADAARDNDNRNRPPIRLGTAMLIFLGSLFGSLLGTVADFGDALDTIERFESFAFPELCIVGSNTILGSGIGMAEDWKTAFEERENVRVTIRGIGSVSGAREAAEGGCVHVLAMSEPMTEDQYQLITGGGAELDCAAEIGYDVIAFVTYITNPVETLLTREVREILRGGAQNWSEVRGRSQPITILARPGSGTTDLVLRNVARITDPTVLSGESFPADNYLSCSSNGACLDATLSTPGSLYWVSSAWMRTQPSEYIKVVNILRGGDDEAAENPLDDDLDLNNYLSSLVRPLYMYVIETDSMSEEQRLLAERFLRYVRSVEGQQVLERYHYFTFFDRPIRADLEFPPGFEEEMREPGQICRFD